MIKVNTDNEIQSEGVATIVQSRRNLGLFFEDGRVYNLYDNPAYNGPIIEKEDVTAELVEALKNYF